MQSGTQMQKSMLVWVQTTDRKVNEDGHWFKFQWDTRDHSNVPPDKTAK